MSDWVSAQVLVGRMEELLVNYYSKFDKDKLIDGSIPKLLNKYKGKENELIAALEKKYGKLTDESNPGDDASAVSMDSAIKSDLS